jgi:hypothetical protein
VWRVEVAVRFLDGGAEALFLSRILDAVRGRPTSLS